MFLDLIHPVFDGAEAFAVGDVVGHDDSVCALVVAACDGFESFLTSSVPNLQLDGLSIDLNRSDFLHSHFTHATQSLTKSTPIVGMKLSVKTSSYQNTDQFRFKAKLTANLSKREDFPTPELPMRSTLNK